MPGHLMLDTGVQTTGPLDHGIQTTEVDQAVSEDKLGSLPKFGHKRESHSVHFAHILSRPSSSLSVEGELKPPHICEKCKRKKRSYWPADPPGSRPASPPGFSFVVSREQLGLPGLKHAEDSRARLLLTEDLRPEVARQVELQLKRQSMSKLGRGNANNPGSTRPFPSSTIDAEAKAHPQTGTDKLTLDFAKELDSPLERPVDRKLERQASGKLLRRRTSAAALNFKPARDKTTNSGTAAAIAASSSERDLMVDPPRGDDSIITALPSFPETQDISPQNIRDSVAAEASTVAPAPDTTTTAASPAPTGKTKRMQKRRPVNSGQQMQQPSMVTTAPPSTKRHPQRARLNCMGTNPKSDDIAQEVRRFSMMANDPVNKNGEQTWRHSMTATARSVGAAFAVRPASAVSAAAAVRPSSAINTTATIHAAPPAPSAAPVRTASIVPAAPPAAAAGPAETTSAHVSASPVITASPVAPPSPTLTASPVIEAFPAGEASLIHVPSCPDKQCGSSTAEASEVENTRYPEHDSFAQSRPEDLPESEAGDWLTAEAADSPEPEPEKLPEMKPDLPLESLLDPCPLPLPEKDVSHSRQDSGYQSSSEPTKSPPRSRPALPSAPEAEAGPFSPDDFRKRLAELRLRVCQAREELLTPATAPGAAGVPPQPLSGLKEHLETHI